MFRHTFLCYVVVVVVVIVVFHRKNCVYIIFISFFHEVFGDELPVELYSRSGCS